MYGPHSKDYIPELGELFWAWKDRTTGEFLQKLADIIAGNGKRDVHFFVSVCTKKRFLREIYHKTFTWDTILPFLFEKCGEKCWEVDNVDQFGPHNGWWTYAIYLVVNEDWI